LALPVGRSFQDQGVRVPGEPVDGGLRQELVGGHGQPLLGSRLLVTTVATAFAYWML